jgi:hypothetical protein
VAQPTPYSRQYNFTNFQAVSPNSPLPANYVDLELNSVKATLDALLNNLKLIQRDDTALANGTVGFDQLKAELNGFGFNPPTTWATNKQYVVRDTVFEGAGFYQCLISHVSGTFADDLTAGDWQLVADFTSATTDAANSATAAAASATTATTEAGTATTQATAAASSATSAATSASSASSSASSASSSATAAATSATNASNSASSASSSASSASTSATNAAASATAAAESALTVSPVEDQINAATETSLADADESGWRQATTGNLIKRSWANLKTIVQTAIDDTTAGHVLTPGAFGFGAPVASETQSMTIPGNDYNQALIAGVYAGAGSSAVNGPPNSESFGPLLVLRRFGTSIIQVAFFGGSSNTVALSTRASNDGGSTWSAWSNVYNDAMFGQQLLPTPNSSDSTTDLNTLTTPGWQPHLMNGAAPNAWGGTNYCYVLTLVYNATNITQMAFGYGSGGGQTACYIRQRFSGTWSGWAEIYTSSTGIPWSALLTSPVPSTTTMPVGWSGQCTATASVSSGASTAGSNLKPSGSSVSQSGTWLNLSGGTIAASGVGLFVRTA